ncbi:MAG: hypothetical protein ACOX4I_08515 [Anaerovoracaceae bacterium]
MSKFLDKAKELGSKAADQAGDLAEIGKYKTKIAGQKSEIKDNEIELGKYIFQQFKDGEMENVLDEQVIDLCNRISSCYDEIEILEEKIEKVKE